MAFNITVPWKVHLTGAGSGTPKGRGWWTRRKNHDTPSAHPALMKEQDLDHLGALHDADLHAKKRNRAFFRS